MKARTDEQMKQALLDGSSAIARIRAQMEPTLDELARLCLALEVADRALEKLDKGNRAPGVLEIAREARAEIQKILEGK